MPRRVAVTGIGLVSPHGRDPEAVFDALLEGRSAIGLSSVGQAPHTTTIASAVCADFDAAAVLGRGRAAAMDRFSALGVAAAASAWRDAGLDAADALSPEERERACVMWGTGGGGVQTTERGYRALFLEGKSRISPLSVVLGMHNAAAAHVSLQFGLGGACLTYSVACASAAAAIAEGMRRVRAGDCEVALVGGSEAALPYGTVKAWQSLQVLADPGADPAAACRPFDRARRGLVLGEGAAALVLEDFDRARARGAAIHAELAGAGHSADHAHLSAPSADGQLRALRSALRDAGAQPSDVAYVNAHGTATPEGDPVEIAALRTLCGDAAPAVSSTKSMHGHLMGAAGALEAVITVLAVQRGAIPPTANLSDLDPACAGVDHVIGHARRGVAVPLALSSAFAFGGSNVVLAFRRA
jgi:3-oxoacyl-[acyl-carrier-protein] synthase II